MTQSRRPPTEIINAGGFAQLDPSKFDRNRRREEYAKDNERLYALLEPMFKALAEVTDYTIDELFMTRMILKGSVDALLVAMLLARHYNITLMQVCEIVGGKAVKFKVPDHICKEIKRALIL